MIDNHLEFNFLLTIWYKTSTLGSLVQPYRVQAKIDSNVTIGFEFEGEALDLNMKIEDTELEDEDIVEVKISS